MRILFLGNSHTYFYGMPFQCREMMKRLGVESEVVMITQPGRSLLWHADNPASRQALLYDSWDEIVLQQATHPFAGTDSLCQGIAKLLDLMPAASPVRLYNTWCEQEIPENQRKIDAAFRSASKKFQLPVIKVASVWHEIEALTRDPKIRNLYYKDRRHAGRTGSYVTALCMARALSGKSVLGLPCSLRANGKLINRISSKAAKQYQAVVDKTIKV